MSLLIFLVILILLVTYLYNKLVRRKNEVDNATGSINAMLKNRYDLIPNLVETVKRYMTYETDVLNKLTTMRTMTLGSENWDADKIKLDEDIAGTMKQVMVAVENYPELKASHNFMQLQESWRDIEDRISASRRFYNNAVVEYNIAIATFPSNLLAKIMKLAPKSVFAISPEESANMRSKDLFNN